MPVDVPQIGETWELQEPGAERPSQAVVVEVTPQRRETAAQVRLVNRLGRAIIVPTRSFLQMWHFLHESVTHNCWYLAQEGCDRRASLQVNDRNGWTWVCDRHLPVGQQALFPFDMTGDRDNLTVLEDQCPKCRTSMSSPGSGTECDPDTGVVVQRCGRCGSQWVSLLGRGEADEGVQLCEQITDAAEALHGRVVNVSAIVGFTAWAAIRRIVQPASHVAGTPLRQTSSGVGPNNVIVIGDRPGTTAGVQRLSGLPSLAPTPAEPDNTVVRRSVMSPLTPAIGSIWQAIHGAQLVEVVDNREDPIDREVVVFRDGPVAMANSSLPIRTFLGRYTPNGKPRTHPVPVASSPISSPCPRAGDTWWQRRVSRPVFVVAVEVDDDGRHLVRYKDVGPPVAIEMDEFLNTFTFDPPDPGCAVGEEWADENGVVLKIEEIRVGRREVIGSTATTPKMMVPLAIFVTRYRKIIRRSVYERLLEDDEDDDP